VGDAPDVEAIRESMNNANQRVCCPRATRRGRGAGGCVFCERQNKKILGVRESHGMAVSAVCTDQAQTD